MKLWELKEKINSIDDKFLDSDVLVDVEAAEYTVHMADITDICSMTEEESGIQNFVSISLDHSVKLHKSR